MSTLLSTVIVRLAEEGGEKVSKALSYGIGAIALTILLGLLLALLAFGGGREHT